MNYFKKLYVSFYMRIYLGIIFISMLLSSFIWSNEPNERENKSVSNKGNKQFVGIDSLLLNYAFKGVGNIQDSLHETYRYIAIVDFSKPSTEQRFYLIDLYDTSLVCIEHVCHGKHSGENLATSFSNEYQSNKSSLGFYKLSETYFGEHGLSIRMDGLDQGYNNNARERAIVMHTAAYADTSVIKELGRLGRSLGCPTLPQNTFNKIATQLSNNAIIFHYYPDADYLTNSVWLH